MLELVVMVGVPTSGKSTYANTHYPSYIRVNYDLIAEILFGVKFDLRLKKPLIDIERIAINANFEIGNSVVADSTNITAGVRAKYLSYASEFTSPVRTVAVYIPINLEEALGRNANRNTPIPEGVIRSFYERITPPSKEEGFDEVIIV